MLQPPDSADLAYADPRWQSFVRRAEDMLGHHLNCDQAADHYSLDQAYDAFREGQSVVEYALAIKAVTS
jgi:hypothetical protein